MIRLFWICLFATTQGLSCDNGCGADCKYKCPFGFPCIRDIDCISSSCTAKYCDAGMASSFRILPSDRNKPKDLFPFGNTEFSGRITYYGDSYNTGGRGDPPPIGPENGGWYGSCYLNFGIPKNWNKFAALNRVQYLDLGLQRVCGACVNISSENRFTIVQIVDMCPSCSFGALDISHQGMAELMGSYEKATFFGFLKNAQWKQVDCSHLKAEAFFTQKS